MARKQKRWGGKKIKNPIFGGKTKEEKMEEREFRCRSFGNNSNNSNNEKKRKEAKPSTVGTCCWRRCSIQRMLRSCRFCTCWLAESPRSRLSSCSTNWAADSLAFQPIGAKEKASTAGPQLRVCRLDVDRSNQRTVVSFLLLLFFSFFFSVRATSFFFFHSLVRQRHLRSTRPQFFFYIFICCHEK